LAALVKDQLLFAWGHLNFPYFTQLKFILLTALINIFLLTFWSHKTCHKSFAIPITYTGYDGCPSRHRFPQAKLIFPLDLPTTHQPLSSSRSPWNSHTLLSLLFHFSCRCFFFLHFLRAQKLLEGFCRDSSESSKCALPISWPLNNSLLSFVEHVSLFSIHNWGWNMQCQLETCQTRFTFSLWLPPLSSPWLSFTSTHAPFFYQKTIAKKMLSCKFKKCLNPMLFEIFNSRIQPNSKKNRQISLHGFQAGSPKKRNMLKIF
jgi:hypothetical protein